MSNKIFSRDIIAKAIRRHGVIEVVRDHPTDYPELMADAVIKALAAEDLHIIKSKGVVPPLAPYQHQPFPFGEEPAAIVSPTTRL